MANLISLTDRGLYCEQGDFFIDPWKPVQRAVITHAHGDHARPGSERYLTTTQGLQVLRTRMAPDAEIDTVDYGKELVHGGVRISLHPAGHILGSAQVRVEYQGEVWVVSGDYKVAADATCESFTPVVCDTFVTECTFGLPIYRWPSYASITEEINRWWRSNRDAGRASVIFAYSLGKAQRVIAVRRMLWSRRRSRRNDGIVDANGSGRLRRVANDLGGRAPSTVESPFRRPVP